MARLLLPPFRCGMIVEWCSREAAQKETAQMDDVTERAEIDQKLGELEKQRQASGPDLEKINQVQEKIGGLQKRKNELLGIAE
jgi:hypothetical protein